MADKKITDLELVSSVTDALNFPVDDTLTTKRATIAQVKTYLAPINIAPDLQRFLSSTGTAYLTYAFVVSGASASAAATYTNNGITYTVVRTVSSGNLIYLTGSGAPTASGTLTKASGTGDSSIVFSLSKSPLYLRVRGIGGGGGGGGGSNSGNGSAGGNGGNTTFGSSLLTGNGGTGGAAQIGSNAGGTGGTATIASPAYGNSIQGAYGNSNSYTNGSAAVQGGVPGVATQFGGGGGRSDYSAANGHAQLANTGAGGAGGDGNYAGASGGNGGHFDAIIPNPSASYAWVIGAAGTAGTAGAGGAGAGYAGGSGCIEMYCHYQ